MKRFVKHNNKNCLHNWQNFMIYITWGIGYFCFIIQAVVI